MTATGMMKDVFERHGIYSTTIVTTNKHHVPDKETENLSITKYSADLIRNLKIETDAAKVFLMENESADEFGVYTDDQEGGCAGKKRYFGDRKTFAVSQ